MKGKNRCPICRGEGGFRDFDGDFHPCHNCTATGRVDGHLLAKINRLLGDLRIETRWKTAENADPIEDIRALLERERRFGVRIKGRRKT
jgi:hypothetical protein